MSEARTSPSLDPTRNGRGPGPHRALIHHSPQGPCTLPFRIDQLERWGDGYSQTKTLVTEGNRGQ